jgi:hypothetical protein
LNFALESKFSTTYASNENTTDSFFSTASSLRNEESAGIFHILESQSIESTPPPSKGSNIVLSDFTEGLTNLDSGPPDPCDSNYFMTPGLFALEHWEVTGPLLGECVSLRGSVEISGNIREAALFQVRKPSMP